MRTYLPKNTILKINNELYQIIGDSIGEGGGSIIYPAVRLFQNIGLASSDKTSSDQSESSPAQLYYAIKECFPLSDSYEFVRDENLEIVPSVPSPEYVTDNPTINPTDYSAISATQYLRRIQQMQLEEAQVTAAIYKKGFRLTPIIMAADSAEISSDYGFRFTKVNNTYTVMESLEEKGRSLESYLKEYRHFSLVQALRSVEQILLAVDEVHKAGYLHLDLQAGNIFLKGSLEDTSDFATLIDFGAARARMEDGKTEEIVDRMLFASKGYSAPEMLLHNDGHLRLGPEADLYSIGYLLLYMLTGRKENPLKLLHNTDGIYISARRMSSLQCPKHLQGTLQGILRRALAVEPEERYHSAQEMIRDVHELSQALQPYRSDLASVAYDAFICYRHNEMDSQIAKALQTQMEHFHVPRSVRSNSNGSKSLKSASNGNGSKSLKSASNGNNSKSLKSATNVTNSTKMTKKKIERVFLDQGELSSCGDMGTQIGEALKNSGYLIVLCSKGTKESPWVNLEIGTFLKYHDRSRILAILTEEGEPDELFPDQLKESIRTKNQSAHSSGGMFVSNSSMDSSQVFAADIRSANYKDALKRLKKDAIYRIAAPILGTTYDSLKQRRKVYAIQRTVAACAILLIFAIAFAGTYLHQNRKISQANQQQLRADSNALIREAATLKENEQMGDAVRKLLEALPSKDNPRPLVPKAQNNLTDYLELYRSKRGDPQQLELIVKTENPQNAYTYILDPAEEYLLFSDDMTIYVLDSIDLSMVHTYSLDEPISDLMTDGESNKEVPLRQENIDAKHGWLFTHSNDQVICYDYKKNELVWSKEMTSLDQAGGDIAFLRYDSGEGRVYVVADSKEGSLLAELEAENGEVCAKSRISTDSLEHTYIEANVLAFLKENAIVFMTEQYTYATDGTDGSFNKYIYVFDKNLKQRAKVDYQGEGLQTDTTLYGVNLMENESVLLYMTEEPYDAEDGEGRGKGYIAGYDIKKQKALYKKYVYDDHAMHYSCDNNLMALDEQFAVSIAKNEFLFIDAMDGNIISKGVDDWDTSLSKRDFQDLRNADYSILKGEFLWNARDYATRFYDSFGTEYQFNSNSEEWLGPEDMEVHIRDLFPEEEGKDNLIWNGNDYIANEAKDTFYIYDGSTLHKYAYVAENSYYHPLNYTRNYLDNYTAVGEWNNQTIFLHNYSYDEEDGHGNRIYYDELYYVDENDEIHRIPLAESVEPDQCELKGDIFSFIYSKDVSEDGYMKCFGRVNLVDEEVQTRELAWDDYSGNVQFFLWSSGFDSSSGASSGIGIGTGSSTGSGSISSSGVDSGSISGLGIGSAACTAHIKNGQIILNVYEIDPSDDEEIVIDTGKKELGENEEYADIYADPSGKNMLVYVGDQDTYYLIGMKPSKEDTRSDKSKAGEESEKSKVTGEAEESKEAGESEKTKVVRKLEGKILKEIPSQSITGDNIVWSEDGAYFLFNSGIYNSSGKEISRIQKEKNYDFRLISPDNHYIYYIFHNNLYQFDLSTGTLLNEKRIFTLNEDGQMQDSDDYGKNPTDEVDYQYWKIYNDKLFLSTRFGSSWLISTEEDAFGVIATIPDEAVYNENLQKFYVIKYYPEEGEVPFGYYDVYSLEQIREIAEERYGAR